MYVYIFICVCMHEHVYIYIYICMNIFLFWQPFIVAGFRGGAHLSPSQEDHNSIN